MSKISKASGTISGGLVYGNAVTVDINANTNNLVIPDIGNTVLVRLNVTGNYSITGIVTFDITKAQEIRLINVGTGNCTLKNNDAGSLAQNRMLLGANKTVQSDEGITLIYDPIDLRHRTTGITI